MRCPECAFPASAVVNSRPRQKQQQSVYRRRKCLKCNHAWTTFERNEAEIRDDITKDEAINCLVDLLVCLETGADIDPHLRAALRAARKIVKTDRGLKRGWNASNLTTAK